MNDALPFWFWAPAAIILWSLLIFPWFISVDTGAEPDPNAQTPLDIYERTGIYPHAAVTDRPRR